MPIYQTFWIIANVVAGIVFYKEWDHFEGAALIMFPIGILTTLIGVAILSQRHSGDQTVAPGGANDEERQRLTLEDDGVDPSLAEAMGTGRPSTESRGSSDLESISRRWVETENSTFGLDDDNNNDPLERASDVHHSQQGKTNSSLRQTM